MNTENMKALMVHTLEQELEESVRDSSSRLNELAQEVAILRLERNALREIAVKSAETFRAYEELHNAKRTPDGDQKAACNRNLAEAIEAVLTTIKAFEETKP